MNLIQLQVRSIYGYKKITRLSMLLAISVVLSLIESLIPLLNGIIPGIKLGFANIVILFTLYTFSLKDAFIISILRVFLVGILRTGVFSNTLFFSLFGALLSLLFMYMFKKFTKLSIVGVSIIGSVMHTIGQIIIAVIFLSNVNILYYLPILLITSIVTGIIVGYISNALIAKIK